MMCFTLSPAIPPYESAMLRLGKWTFQSGSAGTEPPPPWDGLPLDSHADEKHLPPHFSHQLGSLTEGA